MTYHRRLLHKGVSYHLTRGHLRTTIMVGPDADDHVGTVTQLALPHAVVEWIAKSVSTPQVSEPEEGDNDPELDTPGRAPGQWAMRRLPQTAEAIAQRDKLLDAYEELVRIMINPHYRMTEIELHAQDLWSLRRRNL